VPGSSLDHLLRAILEARVPAAARETPLEPARRMSARLGCTVLLKREDLSPVHSFKLRGAYNRIARLGSAERERGVIAASAGNHAQGVAWAARDLCISAVIVMPATTPEIKVDAVRDLGADVVLAGITFADAKARADALAAETGRVFIHPFDDPDVVAGAGTVAPEILHHELGDVDAIFVPVGGGGLLAGIAAYVAAVRPSVQVYGVEPDDADSMARSLEAGERVILPTVGIFADGVAVAQPGVLPFEIACRHCAGVIRVTNDEIAAATKEVFEDTRAVVEPAGALAVAGLRRWAEEGGRRGLRLAAVLSGANIDFERLGFIVERAALGERREALLAATIPERPGAFREFCALLGDGRVITEFNYRLADRTAAHVFAGVAVRDQADAADLVGRLRAAGLAVADLSADETAKVHVRHMVGGRSVAVRDERILRVEFPERPGALMGFLDALAGRWNISLFHYRNHGADFGRVLAGFEVPEAEMGDFRAFIDSLGFPWAAEDGSPAYELFLR
jgi:threonine dehydratase